MTLSAAIQRRRRTWFCSRVARSSRRGNPLFFFHLLRIHFLLLHRQGATKGRLLQARLRSRGQPRKLRRPAKPAVSTAARRAEAAGRRKRFQERNLGTKLGYLFVGDEALCVLCKDNMLSSSMARTSRIYTQLRSRRGRCSSEVSVSVLILHLTASRECSEGTGVCAEEAMGMVV
jgi:hypothetical protein